MGVYSLNNISYLEKDIASILDRITNLYYIDFNNKYTILHRKIKIDEKIHWASKECTERFNALIPEIKSLHKDMYAIIETIFIDQKQEFKPTEMIDPYIPHFKEFRLLNNKLKHFKDKDIEIDIVQRVDILPTGNYIDVICQFKYPDDFIILSFSTFIGIFINILEALNILSIEKN